VESQPPGEATASGAEHRRWDRFMGAYNAIESHLRKALSVDGGRTMNSLLTPAMDQGLLTPQQRQVLDPLVKLRNAISHGPYRNGRRVADPVEEVVEEIERLHWQVFTPPLAGSVLGAQQVVTFQDDAPLEVLLRAVKQDNYSQFPIYSGTAYVGLLTTNAVARWLAQQMTEGGPVSANAPLASILTFREKDEKEAFLPADATAASVVRALSASDDGDPPHLAVILTTTGQRDEAPIALAVADDLHLLVPAITV
jgi:hypothetical protein